MTGRTPPTDDRADSLDAFFEAYRRAFTALDLDAIVEHYSVPLLSVMPDDVYWLTDEDGLERVMAAYLEHLREGGYDRGEIDAIAYHALSSRDVLVSSAWTRYTVSDDVFERLGTTYLLREDREAAHGWEILALVVHDPATALVE